MRVGTLWKIRFLVDKGSKRKRKITREWPDSLNLIFLSNTGKREEGFMAPTIFISSEIYWDSLLSVLDTWNVSLANPIYSVLGPVYFWFKILVFVIKSQSNT